MGGVGVDGARGCVHAVSALSVRAVFHKTVRVCHSATLKLVSRVGLP